MEKIAIFTLAGGRGDDIPESVADILFEYSKIVADQGLFVPAAKYCRYDDRYIFLQNSSCSNIFFALLTFVSSPT